MSGVGVAGSEDISSSQQAGFGPRQLYQAACFDFLIFKQCAL